MAFSSNPLSLSVPEPVFESWLRDTGYLEILDQRTTDLHRHSSTATTAAASASSSDAAAVTNSAAAAVSISNGVFVQIFSYLGTLLSLFTLNPFAKLTSDDFSGDTPSWTRLFVGSLDSYSFPSSPSQARLRVHENVKRYARNYTSLFLLFFACSLYQKLLALVGLILCLALWDVLKLCGDRWGLEQRPVIRQSLIRIAQCATAVILFCTNVQMALISAIAVSYAVMILHASFRKLTPSRQSTSKDGNRRTLRS
ncbi:PRA1 family protein H [Nicotiana tabacum]|uniref:PRA1 family protein H n=2 Tax=Nicotiana TaxID=4085 RepID=A0AC58RTH4_TOBAC|nr:PREDICTED: PRA1 family protein H isoform X1 [Nicotiana sylvestris]